jgi:hypothetical protein
VECPTCRYPMSQGEITLESTFADLVTGGGAFSELRFKEPAQKPVTIMAQSDSQPALHCKTCGFFVIVTDLEYTDAQCVVCFATMPAGVTSCPECGWTYQAGAV